MRDGKPNGFHFLDHRTTDAKYNVITDTYITAGNIADSEQYLAEGTKKLAFFINKFVLEKDRALLVQF